MYAIDFTKSKTATAYAVKLNSSIVKTTGRAYWKKDLLETSLNGYCKYIINNHKVFLDDYLNQKFSPGQIKEFLLKRLTADKDLAGLWPIWYCRSAGYPIVENDEIELLQYHFMMNDQQAIITDSLSIFKMKIK